jgi:hypothetical protein
MAVLFRCFLNPSRQILLLLSCMYLSCHYLPSSNHRTLYSPSYCDSVVKVKVMLRPTVSRAVYLGVKPLSAAQDQIFITVRQLRVCWCGAPSLARGRVCRLQLLLALASAVILGSESRGTHDQILLSQIRDSRTWGTRSPCLYPPGAGWPSSVFVASYNSQGCGVRILTSLYTWNIVK